MRTTGDMGANQRSFRVEDICINLLQFIAAFVIVAVTGGSGKAGGTDTVFLESGQYFCLIVFGNLINRIEALGKLCLNFFTICVNFR